MVWASTTGLALSCQAILQHTHACSSYAGRNEGIKCFINPLRKYMQFLPVCPASHILLFCKTTSAPFVTLLKASGTCTEDGMRMQAVRRGTEDFRTFRRIMSDLLADIKKRGEPPETDTTIAAHLLRIRDPHTGTPLLNTSIPMWPHLSTLRQSQRVRRHLMTWSFRRIPHMGLMVAVPLVFLTYRSAPA